MGWFSTAAKNQAAQSPAVGGLQLQTSAYGSVVPVLYGQTRIAPSLVWYGDFIATAQQSQAGSGGGKGGVGGGGGKGGGGSVSYTYATAVAMGLCEGPIQNIGNVYVDKNITTLASLGFSLFTGPYPQTSWTYLTSKHPGQDLGYNGLAYVAASSLQLGTSPQLPNHNFEVAGVFSNSIAGQVDADPSLIIPDITNNIHYGVNFPTGRIGDLSVYQAYCLANGLWISPAYTSAQQAQQSITDITTMTNSAPFWSEGKIKIVPYGDQTVTGNGYTYTPPSVPLFDLNDDDYLPNQGAGGTGSSGSADPVLLVQPDPSDAYNWIQLEWLDRTNQYNPSIAEAKDQARIDVYGLIGSGSTNAHMFCDGAAARLSAQLQLQRAVLPNQYQFTTDIRYVVLEQMDIITLTDVRLGLNKQWVRVIDIVQNQDKSLTFTTEEVLFGSGSAATYTYQSGSGYSVDYNTSPGDVNTPVIFDAPVEIAASGLETWLGVSGGTLWGGCDVYISDDDMTYKLAGRIQGRARQGLLTSIFHTGVDPDVVNTLAVDLSESFGALLSGNSANADNFTTLCYVDGELIAYSTATLTTAFNYNLTTYIRRGLYGTAISSHALGSQFLRLDDGVFIVPYTKDTIGKTIYVKFCSFNIFGGALQGLSDVTAFSHTLTGPPNPADVTGFAAQQSGNVVAFFWDKLLDFALKGYDIGYAPQGTTDWTQFTFLTEVEAGTEMTTASIPPGTWTFAIRGRDIADQLSVNPTYFDLTVINVNDSVLEAEQDPDWLGDLSGLVLHWTGVLYPMGSKTLDQYLTWASLMTFVPDPVATGSYTMTAADTGFDDLMRVWSTTTNFNGPGASGIPQISTQLDFWLTGQTDPNVFIDWTIGNETIRYLRMRMIYQNITAGEVSVIDTFDVHVDRGINDEIVDNQTIAPGGSAVVFPQAFHFPPLVLPTYTGGANNYHAVASSVTNTGCIINVFNATTGISVGGPVTYEAKGI